MSVGRGADTVVVTQVNTEVRTKYEYVHIKALIQYVPSTYFEFTSVRLYLFQYCGNRDANPHTTLIHVCKYIWALL